MHALLARQHASHTTRKTWRPRPALGLTTHLQQRQQVLLHAGRRHLRGDGNNGGNRFLPHHCLINSGQRLQWRQQEVRMLRAAHERHELAQLLCQRQQDLIFIIHALVYKRNELPPRALLACIMQVPQNTEATAGRRQWWVAPARRPHDSRGKLRAVPHPA